jgi:hypothetical protein
MAGRTANAAITVNKVMKWCDSHASLLSKLRITSHNVATPGASSSAPASLNFSPVQWVTLRLSPGCRHPAATPDERTQCLQSNSVLSLFRPSSTCLDDAIVRLLTSAQNVAVVLFYTDLNTRSRQQIRKNAVLKPRRKPPWIVDQAKSLSPDLYFIETR